MYKLIAIDLDGTLLNSYGEVSAENKLAIKKAIDSRNLYSIMFGENKYFCRKYCTGNRSK